MAITSEEIHNQSFTVDRKGYDVDEVDVFLEHVAAEIDGLNAEIDSLLAQVEELQAQLQEPAFDEPMDMDAAFAERLAEVGHLALNLDVRGLLKPYLRAFAASTESSAEILRPVFFSMSRSRSRTGALTS